MVSEFVNSLTGIQLAVVIFLLVYLLVYGVKYHLLAISAYLTNRNLINNWLGVTLNWCGYISIILCLYWFV